MTYSLAADSLVVLHFAYVAFVVVGLLLILLGLLMRWRWVRNPWFRGIHLLAITIVAVEAFYDVTCPLTTWENQLRRAAGENIKGESFVGWLLNEILFSANYNYDLVNKLHMVFGGLVLLTFVLAPPRFRRASKGASRAGPGAGLEAAAS